MGGKPRQTKKQPRQNVSIGQRAKYPQPKSKLGGYHRHSMLDYVRDGMSAQQRAVFNSVTKLDMGDEAIARDVAVIAVPPGTGSAQVGVEPTAGFKFGRGVSFESVRNVAVTIGGGGWGILLIDHRLTAWAGVDLAAGDAWSTSEQIDMWYSTQAYAGTIGAGGVAFNNWNPSVGVTGIIPASSIGSRGYINPSPSTTGDYGCIVTGQKISYVTTNTPVQDRGGRMWLRSTPSSLPDTLKYDDIDDDPRTATVDSAALTPSSHVEITRNPNVCGVAVFMQGGASAHAVNAGHFSRMGLGYTLVALNGPIGQVFTFNVETAGVYLGTQISPEFPICWNSHAYSVVCCALAHAMLNNTTNNGNRSSVFRKAYKQAERAVAQQTPSFLGEIATFLGSTGVKLASHMGSQLLKAITL